MDITDYRRTAVTISLTAWELEQVVSGLMFRAHRLEDMTRSTIPGDWQTQKVAVEAMREKLLAVTGRNIEDNAPVPATPHL
jgi:hypothetical protein